MKKNHNFNKVWVSGATKTTEITKVSKPLNALLWLVSVAIVVLGVVITMYSDVLGIGDYSAYSSSIVVVTVLLALLVARFTNQGRKFWAFFNASKLELSKVVWPTRKETMTISVLVVVVTIIFSVLISIFGMIFGKIIQYLLS